MASNYIHVELSYSENYWHNILFLCLHILFLCWWGPWKQMLWGFHSAWELHLGHISWHLCVSVLAWSGHSKLGWSLGVCCRSTAPGCKKLYLKKGLLSLIDGPEKWLMYCWNGPVKGVAWWLTLVSAAYCFVASECQFEVMHWEWHFGMLCW